MKIYHFHLPRQNDVDLKEKLLAEAALLLEFATRHYLNKQFSGSVIDAVYIYAQILKMQSNLVAAERIYGKIVTYYSLSSSSSDRSIACARIVWADVHVEIGTDESLSKAATLYSEVVVSRRIQRRQEQSERIEYEDPIGVEALVKVINVYKRIGMNADKEDAFQLELFSCLDSRCRYDSSVRSWSSMRSERDKLYLAAFEVEFMKFSIDRRNSHLDMCLMYPQELRSFYLNVINKVREEKFPAEVAAKKIHDAKYRKIFEDRERERKERERERAAELENQRLIEVKRKREQEREQEKEKVGEEKGKTKRKADQQSR
jgi:hypothetical protein